MKRIWSFPAGPSARVLLLTIIAGALSLAGTIAHAGLGDMVKSAKNKVSGGSSSAKGGNVQFDDTTIELTGDVLDKLLACRKPAAATLQESAAMAKRMEAIRKEMDDLYSKNSEAISANANKRSEVAQCRVTAFEELRDTKVKSMMQQAMADPRSAEKLARLTAATNDAQMKGDTATVNRLSKEMEAIFAPTRADSLAVDKQCGQVPALHPAQVRLDTLQKEYDDLARRIRESDEKATLLQVESCKMPKERIAMAWERIQLYLERGPGSGFTDAELAALGERKGALAAAL